MIKEIEVFAADGSAMTPTFYKRAKQLVKTGRAAWVSDSAIRLVEQAEEEIGMEEYISNNGTRKLTEIEEIKELEIEVSDDEILKMAKKRVAERSALIIHITAYFAVNLFLSIFPGGFVIYVLGGWGIGLACHIAFYFTSATPDAVQREFLKMKHKHRL